MNTVLAVDLGGTKTAMAIVDRQGRATGRRKVPAAHTLDETVSRIADGASDCGVDAVGIIVPGIYDPGSGTAWAPNLWGWSYVPLRAALEQRLGVPAVIAGDRAGYVLGEQWLGAARGSNDAVFVAVGTGIGVGIIAGGRLISGAHGISGAAGWMAVGCEWKPGYAQTGCWEAEAAGPAVARRAGMESAEAVVAAARDGDARALEVLRETAEYLGAGVANLISVFDPEIVVLGGGLMQAGGLLLDDIRCSAARWAQPLAFQKVKIEMTQLGEDAGLFGAARLAFLHAFDKE